MPKFFVNVDPGRLALVPTSHAAAIEMSKLKRGVALAVEPKQPRNTKQHRLFFAFASLVADALNDGPTLRDWDQTAVVTHLKLATGHVDMIRLAKGDRERLGVEFAAVPASISFAKMDNQAFSAFMDRAFIYVRDELCQWIADSDHWSDIETILIESGLIGEASDAA